ncbi:MAG: SDR family NAD(P)-dependent oxidoreductase [Lachnospiraceae bacterium]|nr:SDR family NAD(P)-dependent oxidoreductase [Lachnospiraceae bacterium]
MKETVLVVGVEWKLARETAIEFAQNGYQVYAAVLGSDSSKAETLHETGTKMKLCTLHGEDETQFASCVQELKDQIGVLDYLIVQEDYGCERMQTAVPSDYEKIGNTLEYYVCGVKSIIDEMLPLMRKGSTRRIAFLSSEMASINLTEAASGYEFYLSQSALHMMLRLYFNILRPEEFTFRCAVFSDHGSAGRSAYQYITCNFSDSKNDPPCHSEENRLVMRGDGFREIPW